MIKNDRFPFRLFPCFIILLLTCDIFSNEILSAEKQPLSATVLRTYMTDLISHNASARDCPAPNFPVRPKDCEPEAECTDDSQCRSSEESCCFNGCVFTCRRKMEPPPIIDWEDEPSLKHVDMEQSAEVRPCTMSPRPAPSEPVGCPAGYVCRIKDQGDPLSGIANSGVCVPAGIPESGTSESVSFQEKTGRETVYLPGGCVLTPVQYKHMQDFLTRAYVVDCFCIGGSIECQLTS